MKLKGPNRMKIKNNFLRDLIPIQSYNNHVTSKLNSKEALQQMSPSAKLLPHEDNPIEKLFIYGLAAMLKWNNNQGLLNTKIKSKVYYGMTFSSFVSLTKDILFKNDKYSVKNQIIKLLNTVAPKNFRIAFAHTYANNKKWVCSKCTQWMTFGLLEWLVGPVKEIELKQIVSSTRTGDNADLPIITDIERQIISNWTTVLQITECRYLAEAKCKSACMHMCRAPTQEFFTNEVGLPLYMKPNFTDNSCLMFFGTQPLPEEIDPLHKEACFVNCNSKPAICETSIV